MKKTFLFFTLLALVAFSACNKEGKDYKDYDKDKKACFDLVYPVTYSMPDASTITGDDKEAIDSAMKDWYLANPDSKAKPSLNYPVEVAFKDGDTKTIDEKIDMILLKKACDDKGDDKDYDKDFDKKECFDLVYPVTYTMSGSATITGNDEEAIDSGIKDWYLANPDSDEKPSLNYPVDIIFEDESTQAIANDDEMLLALKDCYDDDEWDLCTWDEATEASRSAFEKITVKELVTSDDCGCITEGVEKFLENGETKFLIYYGEKGCMGYGIKVTCEDGNCKDGVKCWFEQDCQP
jgi:hypothetical protein